MTEHVRRMDPLLCVKEKIVVRLEQIEVFVVQALLCVCLLSEVFSIV